MKLKKGKAQFFHFARPLLTNSISLFSTPEEVCYLYSESHQHVLQLFIRRYARNNATSLAVANVSN